MRSGKRDSRLGETLLEIAFRSRPPEELLEVLTT
jgi:hypothetical protein